MLRRSLALAPVLAALTLAAPALGQSGESITATGSAQVKVVVSNRHSNAAIAAAVAAAEKQAIPGALSAAHARALIYAQDAGLTLGSVLSVSDAASGSPFVVGPNVIDTGPFGPGKYCGIERRPVFHRVNGREKLVRLRKVHACIVPGYASSTLSVTYAAS